MKSLFHIIGTLSMMLMNVLSDPQSGTCINQVLELNQQQLEHIGFEFRGSDVLFQFSIDDLQQQFHLDNGEYWTTIERIDIDVDTEGSNADRIYLPAAILNNKCEMIYTSSLIKKKRILLPILVKSISETGSKEFIYLFLYNQDLAQYLPQGIDINKYLLESTEVNNLKSIKEDERV